jgi:hypothetical protein
MRLSLALAALAIACTMSLGAEARMRFQGVSESGVADQATQPIEAQRLTGITLPGIAR